MKLEDMPYEELIKLAYVSGEARAELIRRLAEGERAIAEIEGYKRREETLSQTLAQLSTLVENLKAEVKTWKDEHAVILDALGKSQAEGEKAKEQLKLEEHDHDVIENRFREEAINLMCCGNCYNDGESCGFRPSSPQKYCDTWKSDNLTREEREKP